jgi:type I restriction enzyme R subunit
VKAAVADCSSSVKRLTYRVVEVPQEEATDADLLASAPPGDLTKKPDKLELVESAHPDLGKLGVFWHTQGSGKSYSMAFLPRKFAGKSRPSSPFC